MAQLKLLALLIFSATLLTGCGKPEITQSCVMNGYGQGSCSFTNTGDGSGSTCGFIEVRGMPIYTEYKKLSAVFCSGDLKPSSTNKIEFSVIGVDNICPKGLTNSGCEFMWIEK